MHYSKILVLLVFVFLIGITSDFAAEPIAQHYLKVTSNPNILLKIYSNKT